ncbi:uncharacterized protein IWZ02DRAFT_208289 [Phyllosticta citriasiana]|uniref:uncharacterized protein n=1 Tax=Phyllosticta citriasiana TaxID=595635 RepID=UPI0030FD5A21
MGRAHQATPDVLPDAVLATPMGSPQQLLISSMFSTYLLFSPATRRSLEKSKDRVSRCGEETSDNSCKQPLFVVFVCQHSHSPYSYWTVWWQSQPTHRPRDVSPSLLAESLSQKNMRRPSTVTSASDRQLPIHINPIFISFASPERLRANSRWGLLWPFCTTDGAAPFSATATATSQGHKGRSRHPKIRTGPQLRTPPLRTRDTQHVV